MAFSTDELAVVNQALGRIGSTIISTAENGSLTCDTYTVSNLHYSQVRDSLLRSFEWSFAVGQATLSLINTMELDAQPRPANWIVDDTITGLTSGETATILVVNSPSEYEIGRQTGTFTDGERFTNATVITVYYEGVEVTYEGLTVTWHADDDSVVCGTGYPVVTAALPTFRYGYQFELPDDYDQMGENWEGGQYWTVQGNRLLSSESEVEIEYVKSITDPTKWDSLFTEVLILSLALRLLTPLAGQKTTTFRQELVQELRVRMAQAKCVNDNESTPTGEYRWSIYFSETV